MAGPVELKLRVTNLPKNLVSRVSDVFSRESSRTGREAAERFVTEARTYPPEGPGNAPPHPYWKRGTGRVMASGGVNPASQNFKANWTITESKAPFQTMTLAQNPTTYGKYLMDDELQTVFHKRAGWKTFTQIAEKLGISATKFEGSPAAQGIVKTIENAIRNLFSS